MKEPISNTNISHVNMNFFYILFSCVQMQRENFFFTKLEQCILNAKFIFHSIIL